MRLRISSAACSLSLTLVVWLSSGLAQKEHGFDNKKPSGQPYLSAEEAAKAMKVPPGWEVKVFAAEPDVINPIAFTIDERGRVWVVECYEYPKRTPKDRMPQDRIKILEDTDGDGKSDKVTVWAEGKDFPVRFDMASGIEVGHGGVFLGAPPYLFFLRDTYGKGQCDKHEILLSGFGSQDTHETLNTFNWGPDGRLYGLHGVFTHSEVQGVKMNAAVWRYTPPPPPLEKGGKRGGAFEVFAEGTSNPWGMDFDSNGQCFLTCCVIPHLFHMIPGGTYIRQAGASFNPYTYGLLKEICDHTHHKESGWAHAGLLYLDGKHVPEEYRGSLIMGSIHGCSIKRDTLRRNGSTFIAGHAPDFLVSRDKNFRPINLRWGPDGSIYVIDWHDQNPCHQAAPDSWDKKHGRIYRIQPTGTKNPPPGDWAKKSDQELVDALLGEDNPWKYRTALRLLGERRGKVGADLTGYLRRRALQAEVSPLNLRALWALHAIDAFDEKLADEAIRHDNPWLRAWAIRFVGESEPVSEDILKKLTALAKTEKTSEVRLQLASTARRLSGLDTLPLLQNLLQHKEDEKDPAIPLMLWLALESKVSEKQQVLDWLKENAAGNPLVTNEIVPRTMRRLLATGKPEDVALCVQFLDEVKDRDVRRHALRGMAEGLKSRLVDAPAGWDRVYAALQMDEDAELRKLANQLAVHFQDVKALQRAVAVLKDANQPRTEREEAIRALALAHPPDALAPLLQVLTKEKDESLQRAAAAALANYDNKEIPGTILSAWKQYPASVRLECVNTLKSRKEWAKQLLDAVGQGAVSRTDLTDNTILAIRAFSDAGLNQQIEKVWGKYRQTPEELEKLIAQMRQLMHEGKADPERGRLVFEKNCMQCHKFQGKGHDIGPNLDGAERSIEYLLINVLDPNRVVGQPYYQRSILTKKGKLHHGLLAAEDDQAVTLKCENDQLEVIPKKDIDQDKIEAKSLMPEGLDKNISPPEFRDLVRYLMAHPFVTEARVLGYTAKATMTIDSVLPPEAEDGHKELTSAWAPDVGPAGRIPLAREGKKESAWDYVYAEVAAPGAMKTRLLLGGPADAKVWLNGKLIQKAISIGEQLMPDQHAVEVSLEKGVNRLLIKVQCRDHKAAAIYVRLVDPERKLEYVAVKR